ncbi:hypothetical protein [Streptomyces sp. NPDC093089]|uniref:hypothetical protein n=1 Tax=Streptomyces sp. NPDC093089 TaxID=3366024 RepID=UPI0037FC945B
MPPSEIRELSTAKTATPWSASQRPVPRRSLLSKVWKPPAWASTTAGVFPVVAFSVVAFPAGVFPAGVFPAGVFLAGVFLAGVFLAGVFLAGVFLAGVFLGRYASTRSGSPSGLAYVSVASGFAAG